MLRRRWAAVGKAGYRSFQVVQAVVDRAERGRTGDLGSADQAIGDGAGVEGRHPRAGRPVSLGTPPLCAANTSNTGKVSFRLSPATVDIAFRLFWYFRQ